MLRGRPLAIRWAAPATVALVLAACSSDHVQTHAGSDGSLVVTGESEDATSVPTCSWPLTVSGQASTSQTGLVRCYLRALANRSLPDLAPLVIVRTESPVILNAASLAHAPDAIAGTATADFMQNPSDPYSASVDIRYANGGRESIGMDALNVYEPASRSWRLAIGSTPPSVYDGLPSAAES